MENYEQKYKEALERAKKLDEDGCHVLRDVFPELEESEDEKIRKSIIEWFKTYNGCTKQVHPELIESWISWLEMQGNTDIEQVFRPLAGCCIDTAARQAVEQQKQGKNVVLAFNGFYIPVKNNTTDAIVNEYYSWLEKKGEQKPEQTSIWKHWKGGIAGNGEGKLIYLIKDGDTYSLSSCLSFECDYIELSELDKLMLEKQGEKLPVGFYYVNSEGKKFYSDTFKYGDMILHVEKQGEQKETLCDKCKREQPFHSCQDITELGRCALEKQGERIYWKPSEEQMQTLHAQLNEGAVTYPEDKRVLVTLYEDLTKIMTQEEKQGEQKPVDEVEPKFKVGDQVVTEGGKVN